jgi:hypothetical protein
MKLFFICLLFYLFAGTAASGASADTVWYIGKANETDVTATFTGSNATLVISGNGEMRDWENQKAPWYATHRKIMKFIVIEDGVTAIGNYAFSSCQPVESITVGDGVATIGMYAFAYLNALESITFGKNLRSIGNAAFWNCHDLMGVQLPGSLTAIANDAFRYCSRITGVVIPANVETVGANAFAYCSKLKTVTVECPEPPALGSGNFPAAEVFYVPEKALSLYRSAAGWSSFAGSYLTIESLTAISAVRDENPGDMLSPPARYFTLQGREVLKPAKGCIYIVKSGLKTKKILAAE